jgi:hypothetical protein
VSEKLKPLRGEIAALERELKAMREIKRDHGPAIANRKIDTKGCRAIPILCRRLARTPLDLRPLFAQYHQETKGNQWRADCLQCNGLTYLAFAGASGKRYRRCRTS